MMNNTALAAVRLATVPAGNAVSTQDRLRYAPPIR
jgi:hypothetical protein